MEPTKIPDPFFSSKLALVAAGVMFFAAGCATGRSSALAPGPQVTAAVAVVQPTPGNMARGIVQFTQVGDRVKVVADIEGLKPNSRHGFHIHDFGDLRSLDAKSAGSHYNPEGYKHAGPSDRERHAGDLGNIISDDAGKAHYELVADGISIAGDKNPILGRSVVLHADPDDLRTQPTGNSAARIAFGVIGIAAPAQ